MHSKAIRFAASSLVLGATMVGCKPSAEQLYRPATLSAKAAKTDQEAYRSYQAAQVALAKGKLDEALAAMERAVEYSPRDAGYRAGLAELYLKSGRFRSAETAFQDAIALNPGDSRSGVNLALVRMAQGRHASAIAQLHSLEGRLGGSDLGLAYALAGETTRALELLEPAARAADATPRVRQNLALAYALAGDWKKARVTAAQDISPAQINSRLAHWAALASPDAGPMRVANILGVKPAPDPGQPSRLALAPVAPASERYAEAATPPAPSIDAPTREMRTAFAEPAPAAIGAAPAAVDFVPAETLTSEAADIVPAAAPTAETQALAVEAAQPFIEEAQPLAEETQPLYAEAAQTLVEAPAAAEPDPHAARMESIRAHVAARYDTPVLESASPPRARGRYVVQLGAYSTPANVEKGWARAVKRFGGILDTEPLSTTIKLNGRRTLYRLSMAGFSGRGDAIRTCQTIRVQGGACFVRKIAGDSPVQWASRYTRHG